MSLTKVQASQVTLEPITGLAAGSVQELAFTTKDLQDVVAEQGDLRGDLALAAGSDIVGFKAGHADATTRNVQAKLRDIVSVKDFGAGTTDDDTDAFQLAVTAAAGRDYQLSQSPVATAPVAQVYVPNGQYKLSNRIMSSKQITWILDSDVDLDASKLTGVVVRDGRHINAIHTGILENATTLSLRAGKALDYTGGVYGIQSLAEMSRVGPPHSVTLQIHNDTEVGDRVILTGTTYTATTVSYTTVQGLPSNIKLSSIITTQGSPKYMGMITDVDVANQRITVEAWRPFTGSNTSPPGTPTANTVAVVNYFEKIWGQNTNVILRAGPPTEKAVGYELGVLNYRNDSAPYEPTSAAGTIMWGFDAVNLGPKKATAAYLARAGNDAQWQTGFASYGNNIGFHVFPRDGQVTQKGFVYQHNSGLAFQSIHNGKVGAQITWDGRIELGDTSTAQQRYIDFHTGGYTTDYDVRLISTGGADVLGKGTFTVYADTTSFLGTVVRPFEDSGAKSGASLGTSTYRWKTVYAETGTIQTSDLREKQQIEELSEAERAVAMRIKTLLRKFKYNNAVEEKGEDQARIHFGVIAQDVKAAFEAEGLVAERYAVLCYDQWDEIPEQKDEQGNVIVAHRPAGDRYGVRYEELLAFMIAAL